jgi:hypothetical protein
LYILVPFPLHSPAVPFNIGEAFLEFGHTISNLYFPGHIDVKPSVKDVSLPLKYSVFKVSQYAIPAIVSLLFKLTDLHFSQPLHSKPNSNGP